MIVSYVRNQGQVEAKIQKSKVRRLLSTTEWWRTLHPPLLFVRIVCGLLYNNRYKKVLLLLKQHEDGRRRNDIKPGEHPPTKSTSQ